MKKLLLTLVLAISLSLVFTIAVFADRVHNENTVNYGETVTLNDGTTVNIFDNEYHITPTDFHPNENAWNVLTPEFAKKLNL